MARIGHRRRAPVQLRHKILGGICFVLGLGLTAGCLVLTVYVMDRFWAGHTLELLLLDICLGMGGMVFFLISWHQLVVAPKRDHLEQAFRPIRRRTTYTDEE